MAIDSNTLRERLDQATADLDPPYAVVDLTAYDANAAALAARSAGKPVRAASKSIRAGTCSPGHSGSRAGPG